MSVPGEFGLRLGMVVVAGVVNLYLWTVEPRRAVDQVIFPIAPPLVHIEGMGEQTLVEPGQVEVERQSEPPVGMVLHALKPVFDAHPDPAQRVFVEKIRTLEKRQHRLAAEANRSRQRIQQLAVEIGEHLGEDRLAEVISNKPTAAERVGETAVWQKLGLTLKEAERMRW